MAGGSESPFVHEVRVPWGDVDLSTTIYYPKLFHYFECAIEEFFRSRGVEYGKFSQSTGAMLARVAAGAEFRAPIHFHDLLEISVEVARVGDRSVTFALEARRDGQPVARGTSTGAAVDLRSWKGTEVPPKLREVLGPRTETVRETGRKPLLEAPPRAHRWQTRIHAGDVDMAWLVYYPTLLHLFEQSIEELFRAAGAPYRGQKGGPDLAVVFPRVSVRAEFLAPIRIGDLLHFETGVARFGNTSVVFASRATREDGTIAARAEVTTVTVDKKAWKPVPVPDPLRKVFEEFSA